MYITKNLYEKDAIFIDLTDLEFFRECMQESISNFQKLMEKNESINIDVDKIKKKFSPVLYCSKLSKQSKFDNVISRKEMNMRMKRKYLIIDVDYNVGEENESNKLKDKLINLSKKLNCYLLIYPTLSYPEKPRFRAILLTDKLLDESVYYSAISWLYDELDIVPTDMNDYNIKSNNNLPIFVNEEQINFIYSNLDEEDRELLKSDLWKKYPRKKKVKVETYDDSDFLDQVPIDKEKLLKEIIKWSQNHYASQYMNFWLLTTSLARAYVFNQITERDVKKCMKELSKAASNEKERIEWEQNNMIEFDKCVNRLKDKSNLEKTQPLIKYFNGSII